MNIFQADDYLHARKHFALVFAILQSRILRISLLITTVCAIL